MDQKTLSDTAPQPIAALVLAMCLFAIWGFGQRLYDGLLPQFGNMFGQKGIALAIGPAFSTAVYVLGAIPAALSTRSFGYKGSILLGLGIFCVGAFLIYPTTESRSFPSFLCAVAVMTCGWIMLEMAVNPLVVRIGNRDTAIRRLNLAHALYAAGALLGMVVNRRILVANSDAPTAGLVTSLMHPYIVFGVALLLIAFFIEGVRFPLAVTDRATGQRNAIKEIRALFTMPLVRFCVAAQAFGMIGQVGIWNQSQKILGSSLGYATPVKYLDGLILLVAIMAIGRFAGTALMYHFRAERLLRTLSICGIVLSIFAQFVGGLVGAAAVLAANFCIAINWPTVIGLGLRDLGPLMKLAVAPICMGGTLGGFAFVMLANTAFADSPHLTMAVTTISFMVVLWFAIWHERQYQSGPTQASVPSSAEG